MGDAVDSGGDTGAVHVGQSAQRGRLRQAGSGRRARAERLATGIMAPTA